MGIYEVVKITPEIQKIVMADGTSIEIGEVAAREGYNTIYQSAMVKVKHGLTSLEEVHRVTTGH